MPADLGQPGIEDVERMSICSQFVPNVIYAVCERFVATETSLKQDTDEQETLADGRFELIKAGDFMLWLRLRGGFHFDVNSLSDEVVAFALGTTPEVADPGAEGREKHI